MGEDRGGKNAMLEIIGENVGSEKGMAYNKEEMQGWCRQYFKGSIVDKIWVCV